MPGLFMNRLNKTEPALHFLVCVFIAFCGILCLYFAFTTALPVQCGGCKKSPRASNQCCHTFIPIHRDRWAHIPHAQYVHVVLVRAKGMNDSTSIHVYLSNALSTAQPGARGRRQFLYSTTVYEQTQ